MAVDTFFVGTLIGVGKVYLQTVIDCFSRYAWRWLYTSKLPVTAAHVMNNNVLATFKAHNACFDINRRALPNGHLPSPAHPAA